MSAKGITRAAKYVKYGGWIGTTLGAGASVMKVQDVCAAGDAEACQKVKYTETGACVGGVFGGGIASGMLAMKGATAVCTAIGVATVGSGSLAAGLASSKAGEISGDVLYRAQK